MSGEDMSSIQAQINQHDKDIEVLKNSVQSLVTSIDRLATTNTNLTVQFAKYCEKHDSNERDIAAIGRKVDAHGDFIAAARPFLDGMRGIFWKAISGAVIAMASTQAVVAYITKVT